VHELGVSVALDDWPESTSRDLISGCESADLAQCSKAFLNAGWLADIP